MSKTFQQMRLKIARAEQLESVVRTMKAQSAANITQYEMAVQALMGYFYTIQLGLTACFHQNQAIISQAQQEPNNIIAIVFGSDQGLVGQFNYELAEYVKTQLIATPANKKIMVVGERIEGHLHDSGFEVEKTFAVPSMINSITPLVTKILTEIVVDETNTKMLIFYNSSSSGISYKPTHQQLLPLNAAWQNSLVNAKWPSNKLPEIIGNSQETLSALIREHLFISLFRACAESLASENASRLMAMQRAEKNINSLLDELKKTSRTLRQSTIDEELFDVITSYEYG